MESIKIQEYDINYPDGIHEKEFAAGIFEEIFIQKIYGDVNSNDIVIDCGSNLGIFALYSLKNNAEKIVCIDPNQKTNNAFLINCYEGLITKRIYFYKKALWNISNLDLNLDTYHFSAGSMIVNIPSEKTYIVKSITIDDIVNELNLQKVDLIKMDIEGSEENALLGAKNTIIKFKPRLAISLYHKETSQKDIHDILESFNIPFNEEILVHKNPCPNSNEKRVYMKVGHYNFL